MQTIIKKIIKPILPYLITLIYWWGCLWYDKQYLTGKHFDRKRFTVGWRWILRYWFGQKILGNNRHLPWPAPPSVSVAVPQNIIFHPDDLHSINTPGAYFQGIDGKIYIGHGTEIAINTGFITANHDIYDLSRHSAGKDISIGENSWIGMNAIILPGVCLGPRTIVGAGSVVTKSFSDGNCIIAGNPARKIKDL